MRPSIALLPLALLLATLPCTTVHAQQAEAKEAAQAANCKPGKLEALKQVTGRLPETVYKIICTGQKSADGKEMFVVVRCRERICTTMR